MKFQRFAVETPLHGFAIAAQSSSKADLVCWLLMVFLCAFMTVQQTAMLVKMYSTEPTAVTVSWKTNEDMILDQLVISIPYLAYVDELTNWDLAEVQDLLQQLNLDTTEVPDLLSNPNFDWPILNYILRMLMRVSNSESGVVYNDPKSSFTWDYVKLTDNSTPIYNQAQGEVFNCIHSFFRNHNVSLVSLLRMTLSRICSTVFTECSNSYTSQDYYSNNGNKSTKDVINDCLKHMCLSDNVAFFDENTMAFKISSEEKPVIFAVPFDSFKLAFNAKSAFNSQATQISDNYQLFLDGRGYADPYRSKSYDNLLSGKLHASMCTFVRVRTAYSFLNLNRKPCLKTTTNSDCQNDCWGYLIQQQCQCWPIQNFRWKRADNPFPFCGEGNSTNSMVLIPNFENCLANRTDLIVTFNKCILLCLLECQSQEFEFIVRDTNLFCATTVEHQNESADGLTTLKLNVESFSYSYTEESLLKDWQTFLNEFGGLIGIWLGGSLIAFAHIPIFLAKWVYFRLKKKREKQLTKQTSSQPSFTVNKQKMKLSTKPNEMNGQGRSDLYI